MARILVVDDELDILSAMSVLLKFDGFEVITASDGVQALKIMHETSIDLILTDWMMPNMDGIELCRLLRADERWRAIPIIGNSAAVIPPIFADWFDAVFHKPCGIDELLEAIRRLLKS